MSSGEFKSNVENRFHGIHVSPGVAHGPLVVISREDIKIPCHDISEEEIPSEVARLEAALVKTREQIMRIKEHLSLSLGEKDASIFDAHLLVVEDSSIVEAVKKKLHEEHVCVDQLYHDITLSFAQSMRELEDPYLQERAADILDIGRRVLNNLSGKGSVDLSEIKEPCIILAHDLSPSDTAMLNRDLVKGFATEVGSRTSHTAIMARSLNIPAVVGLKDVTELLYSGLDAILDGYEGTLIINPSQTTDFEYGKIEMRRKSVDEKLGQLRETLAETSDHRRIILSANVEMPEDLPHIKEMGAEGVGLYRTEYLFLNRLELPTEEEQIEAYRRVFEACHPEATIVRTIDIGGDKMLVDVGEGAELNPFLGWRAIRYCLEQEGVFRMQLRAILRAGHGFHTRVMIPMITTFEELREAKRIFNEVKEELLEEKIPIAEKLEFGIMIEVPSAAIQIDRYAPHVDFVSIGTNDLIQYTLAVDRTNERVANLYQPTHPSILFLMKRVVDSMHAQGKWVGVCGEVAGEILLTPMMVALGVDELSMGSVHIPRVKKALQSLSYDEMAPRLEQWLQAETAEEIERELHEITHERFAELFQ